MKKAVILIIVVSVAGLAGFMLQRTLSDRSPAAVSTVLSTDQVIGTPRPEFSLTDLNGDQRSISEWDGKVILLNFWATWCPPCMREIPALVELQNHYHERGLQVVSIAIDDAEAIAPFADDMGINYPIFPSTRAGIDIARQYGNRIGGLPFTAFINKNSVISHINTGELTYAEVVDILQELGVNTHL